MECMVPLFLVPKKKASGLMPPTSSGIDGPQRWLGMFHKRTLSAESMASHVELWSMAMARMGKGSRAAWPGWVMTRLL
jgi:hypothetical protein